MDNLITTPITGGIAAGLKAGSIVYISGEIYTARDAAHKRLTELIANKQELPFDFSGQIVYYAGPSPAKPGLVIGSIGPTTSGRMDAYSPILIQNGLKFMIGKGQRNESVIKEIVRHKGVYFAAVGGAATLLSQCVTNCELIAFEDLGTEAIRKLIVVNFPVVVAIDSAGKNIYNSFTKISNI